MPFSALPAEMMDWLRNLFTTLSGRKSLAYLLVVASAITLVSGLTLYLIDPNIHTPLDGIWSAWVTMTHVGFGDVVPTSFMGRLLAAGLILFGLVLFSLFTATLSVALLGGNIETLGQGLRKVEQNEARIEHDETRILQELGRLHGRMEQLEKQLGVLAHRATAGVAVERE